MAAPTARKKATTGRSDVRKAVATRRPANVKAPEPAPEPEPESGPQVEIGGVAYSLNPNLTDGLLALIFVAVDAATDLTSQREAATLLSDVFAPGEFLRMTRDFLANGAVPMDDVIEVIAHAVAEETGFPTG